MWRQPAATQWQQDGASLHHWATVHAKVSIEGPTAALLSELRQIEDRHGCSPAAMLRLRWRIVSDQPETATAPAKGKAAASPKDRRASILKLVQDAEGKKA